MPTYRLTFVEEAGGVCESAFRIDLSCHDDDHALRMVRDYADGREMELWGDEQRLVRKWPRQHKDLAPHANHDTRRRTRARTFLWFLSEQPTETA